MADATLSTTVSRRSILAALPVLAGAGGVSAREAPSPTPPPQAGEGLSGAVAGRADARLAVLAARYRRTLSALCDCIAEAEAGHGVFGYWEEPWRPRYDALVARADRLVAAIARLRPDSLFGLAVKLRLAVWRVDMDTLFDCDERLLLPALADLDRLAAAESGGPPPNPSRREAGERPTPRSGRWGHGRGRIAG